MATMNWTKTFHFLIMVLALLTAAVLTIHTYGNAEHQVYKIFNKDSSYYNGDGIDNRFVDIFQGVMISPERSHLTGEASWPKHDQDGNGRKIKQVGITPYDEANLHAQTNPCGFLKEKFLVQAKHDGDGEESKYSHQKWKKAAQRALKKYTRPVFADPQSHFILSESMRTEPGLAAADPMPYGATCDVMTAADTCGKRYDLLYEVAKAASADFPKEDTRSYTEADQKTAITNLIGDMTNNELSAYNTLYTCMVINAGGDDYLAAWLGNDLETCNKVEEDRAGNDRLVAANAVESTDEGATNAAMVTGSKCLDSHPDAALRLNFIMNAAFLTHTSSVSERSMRQAMVYSLTQMPAAVAEVFNTMTTDDAGCKASTDVSDCKFTLKLKKALDTAQTEWNAFYKAVYRAAVAEAPKQPAADAFSNWLVTHSGVAPTATGVGATWWHATPDVFVWNWVAAKDKDGTGTGFNTDTGYKEFIRTHKTPLHREDNGLIGQTARQPTKHLSAAGSLGVAIFIVGVLLVAVGAIFMIFFPFKTCLTTPDTPPTNMESQDSSAASFQETYKSGQKACFGDNDGSPNIFANVLWGVLWLAFLAMLFVQMTFGGRVMQVYETQASPMRATIECSDKYLHGNKDVVEWMKREYDRQGYLPIIVLAAIALHGCLRFGPGDEQVEKAPERRKFVYLRDLIIVGFMTLIAILQCYSQRYIAEINDGGADIDLYEQTEAGKLGTNFYGGTTGMALYKSNAYIANAGKDWMCNQVDAKYAGYENDKEKYEGPDGPTWKAAHGLSITTAVFCFIYLGLAVYRLMNAGGGSQLTFGFGRMNLGTAINVLLVVIFGVALGAQFMTSRVADAQGRGAVFRVQPLQNVHESQDKRHHVNLMLFRAIPVMSVCMLITYVITNGIQLGKKGSDFTFASMAPYM